MRALLIRRMVLRLYQLNSPTNRPQARMLYSQDNRIEGEKLLLWIMEKVSIRVGTVSYTHLSLVAEILCMIPVTCQTVAGLGDQQGFLHAEGRRQKIINLLLLFRG